MMVNRKISPLIKEIKSFNIEEAKKLQLSNGIPLFSLNSNSSEIVKIEFLFSAGNWYQETPLAAFAVNNMLVEGSKIFDSFQIAELVEFYGAQLGYNVDKDNAFVSIVCLQKHLEKVLGVVEDIIKNATFPENELEVFKNKHKQLFLVEQSKVRNIARFIHSRMLFGNQHPYGYLVTPEDFDKLTRDLLIRFYKQRYQASNCRIIASGKVDDKTIQLIEKHFGVDNWNYYENKAFPYFQPVTEEERQIHVDKPDAVQSAIRIGKIMFNKLHPDFVGLSVLNCVLGGYFGSRLMKRIREEKGYTYGINSLLVEFRNSGYFTIVSELGSDVTAPALDDIYSEISRLRNELIPPEELLRVKNYMLGDIVRMFDGSFARAESLISLLEYDLEYDYFYSMVNHIKSITSNELQALAMQYLDPESLYQVVVGKK
ncbi:MAG TPA: pitrilysin family protein [Bacteroidales bacterium]